MIDTLSPYYSLLRSLNPTLHQFATIRRFEFNIDGDEHSRVETSGASPLESVPVE